VPETAPDHVPSPRTPLVWDGTRYRAVRGHTDGTVQVRGEDQVFSYKGSLHRVVSGIISGADGFFDSGTPPAGEIYAVTNVAMLDQTSPTTHHFFDLRSAAAGFRFHHNEAAFAAFVWSYYHGEIWLDPGDVIRCSFLGSNAGDTCNVALTGYRMTLES